MMESSPKIHTGIYRGINGLLEQCVESCDEPGRGYFCFARQRWRLLFCAAHAPTRQVGITSF